MSRRQILGVWAILALGVVSYAFGGQEQWLNYHSSRQYRSFVDGTHSQHIQITTEKPEGVELPEFKSDEPLFGKFKTPMVKDGYLWIALDRNNKKGVYGILYVDSNGNKSLKDETAIAAYAREQSYAQFGPIAVMFDSNDGPITYHFNLSFSGYQEKKYVYVSSGCWYEGQITADGTKYQCMLIDYDSDGTFNEKSINQGKADRIQIKKDGKWESAFVGNYITIADKLYNLKVARDGAFIKLTPAVDVNYGKFRVPSEIVELQVGGNNGSFLFRPENGLCKIPTGQYQILKWSIEEKKGIDVWQLQARGSNEKARFIVTETNEPNLMIGQPVISKLEIFQNEKNHQINYTLEGRLGESITISRNNSRVSAPKVYITNADKSYDKTFNLEYG
ncbi:MAG: hypothetical protein A2Y12_12285 [Planctomycetes bacterium GWF2_42_9]|nr:MAG: hypothetical protein A2Y12_12285 [Planctomycetes bacterium GWF2_42_9]